METTIKSLTRKLEDATISAKQIGGASGSAGTTGSGLTNENHPDVLMEQVKKLKKENALLKQEIENRFDKDKVFM
jgi:hypothetical protein